MASSARLRNGFALTGPSVPLDPRTHAVRPDLADVRLAGRVFAPHFAASISSHATRPADLMTMRRGGSVSGQLAAGDTFDVLEVAGSIAWGIAGGTGLVGYVDYGALDLVE